MDEASLETSLVLYTSQLSQVEQAIQAAGNTDDLVKLKSDLTELIGLTQESLLSLKKSQLLQKLESHPSGENSRSYIEDSQTGEGASSDSEYAAFQAAIAEGQSDLEMPNISVCRRKEDTSDLEAGTHSEGPKVLDAFKDIIGTKCRAPYIHEWGAMSSYNGLIVGIEPGQSEDSFPKARVMFLNPTHNSMHPCPFHLENKCRFSENECRYSHGHIVDLEELTEFEEPDYSLLSVGSTCLARYKDGLWYRATILGVEEEHRYVVSYQSYDGNVTVEIEDIVPLGSTSDDDSEDDMSCDERLQSSRDNKERESDEGDEEDSLPVFLWKPPKTTAVLGEWEVHTKGIGSKIMAKMGYIVGQGLGKSGEGRAEPIPIQLLPQGKSLDKIMELKEIAGEQDLFDVMKRQEKKKKMEAKKQTAAYIKEKQTPSVFDFINGRLGGKRGNLSDLLNKSHTHSATGQSHGHNRPHRNISEQDLHQKTDRNLNVQLLKTHEEMKSVRKELTRLKQSLTRNELRDKKMASQVKEKISSMESYLEKLHTSEKTITEHQQKRSDHKKLTVF